MIHHFVSPAVSSLVCLSTLLGSGRLTAIAKNTIERHLFNLPEIYIGRLKEGVIHSSLRAAFSNEGIALSETSCLIARTSDVWSLRDHADWYTIRVRGHRLIISKIVWPILGRLGYRTLTMFQQAQHIWANNLVRDWVFLISAGLRKRFVEKPSKVMINVGAGKWHRPGWKVVDHIGDWYAYPRLFVDFPYDLTSKNALPFADQSVDLFYSEHAFEHMADEHCKHVFAELCRCLQKGGGLRIVVPDADLIYQKLREKDQNFFEGWMITHRATLEESFLILVAHPRQQFDEQAFWQDVVTLSKMDLLHKYSRSLKYEYARAGEHINWFDYEKLKRMLFEAGFTAIYHSAPQQSCFDEMKGPGFDTRPSYSLHVDAVK